MNEKYSKEETQDQTKLSSLPNIKKILEMNFINSEKYEALDTFTEDYFHQMYLDESV